jgi:F-type H+-transporting ATPase subunit delta
MPYPLFLLLFLTLLLLFSRFQVALEAVGGSYANALVDLAQSKNALEAIHTDVDALASYMKESEDIKNFLSNPTINENKKKDLVKKVASESGFNEYTVNFLNLLIDQNRIEAISEICEAFETRYCELTDTMVATLRSAVKLEQEQQFLIAKKLQELSGARNVKIVPVIDESLIAGFIVEWGASQIDLSVKGQLNKITGELMTAAAI